MIKWRELVGVMMRTPVLLVSLLVVLGGSAAAQEEKSKASQPAPIVSIVVNPAEAREIRKLLDLQGETPGSPQSEVLSVDRGMVELRKYMPGIPERVWQDLTGEMKKEFTVDIAAESLTPVYAETFTQPEIKELIKFFSSPAGRKWSRQFLKIQRGSYNAGFVLGQMLRDRVRESLKAKGYSVPVQ